MKNKQLPQTDDFIEPNKNKLDEELVRQPLLYREYAEKLADARMEAAQAKAAFELAESETKLEIRAAPEKFSLPDKVTEDVIKCAVMLQPEYQRRQKAEIIAKHKVDVLAAVVGALDQRKRSLEKLVDLFLADYFSRPTPKSDKGKDYGRKAKVDQAFGKAQLRRKRNEYDDDD